MEKLKQYFAAVQYDRGGRSRRYFGACLFGLTAIFLAFLLLMPLISPGVIADRIVTGISIIISLILLKLIAQNGQEH